VICTQRFFIFVIFPKELTKVLENMIIIRINLEMDYKAFILT